MSQANQENDQPEGLLVKARQYRGRLDFAESEHWYKVYLLARPQDEVARQELIAMAELSSAQTKADRVRQFVSMCVRHFRVEGDPSALNAAVQNCDPLEIRTQAVELESSVIGKLREAWNLNPDESPWPEGLRRAERLGQWNIVEWILDNCEVAPETDWLLRLKVESVEVLELLQEYQNPRAHEISRAIREAVRNEQADVLSHLIESALQAMIDGTFGDDDGSAGLPAKFPPNPPPSRFSHFRKDGDVDNS